MLTHPSNKISKQVPLINISVLLLYNIIYLFYFHIYNFTYNVDYKQ